MNRRPLLAAALAGLAAWLVLQAMAPLVQRAWQITGDEPHYLLAAHSLVSDGDLDLANNYARADYRAFYAGPFLDPHVRVQPDGAQLLSHDVGLAFVLAPAYAWGGRGGVMQFLAALGGLLTAQMCLLGHEVTGRWWAGLLGSLSLALAAPLGLYVFQIYPELAGGLLLTWALRQTLGTPGWISPAPRPPGSQDLSRSRAVVVALALAALPWLSGRYAPLSALLAGLVAWRWLDNRRARHGGATESKPKWRASKPLIPLAVGLSLSLYLLTNFTFYGGPTPSATPAGNAVLTGFSDVSAQQIGRGLAGWWLDQHRGLLIFGPPLILAFIGLPHLWRQRGWGGLALFAPVTVLWLLASAWGGFYSGWEVSAKFLMIGVPPLAGAVAAAFAGIAGRVRRMVFWPLAAGLITLGVGNALVMWLDPFVMLHESPVALWEDAAGLNLRRLFPAAGTRYLEAPPAGASEWSAARGEARYLHQSRAIGELSIGWYRLYAQAQITRAADPAAVALSFDAFSSEAGLTLLHADVRAQDADPATGLVDISLPFYNPYVDRWSYPFYVDVRATGAADVRVSRLLFEPDPGPTYGVAALWSAGIILLVIIFAPGRAPGAAANGQQIRTSG